MYSNSSAHYLAAFNLGYSLNTLKDIISKESNNFFIEKEIFDKSEKQLRTYQKSYSILFEESLDIPIDNISYSQLADFFCSLFEITEERISNHCNKKLHVYFYAGGLIYLSDSTNVVFEKEKFKFVFYQILSELGSTISWNEMDAITSLLYCSEDHSRKNGKKQLLEYVFNNEINCDSNLMTDLSEHLN